MTTLRGLAKEYAGSVAPEDFSVIAASALGQTKEFVFREPDHALSSEEESKLRPMLRRRTTREPVAYIVGEREFFGLPFFVTKDTLIPRPETELLVEEVLRELAEDDRRTVVVDLGTGSGAIIVSVANALRKKYPESERHALFATDISPAALTVARRNAKRHDVSDRIAFLEGSLLASFSERISDDTERILVVANLPYLSHDLYESASDDVRLHEPESALVAGDEGLALYRELLDDIARKKKSDWSDMRIDGFLEISPEQEPSLGKIFTDRFPSSENGFIPDLSGRTRIFRFRIG